MPEDPYLRSLVRDTASVLARAAAAGSSRVAADPIFAAIEKHQATLVAREAASEALGILEKELVPVELGAEHGMDGPRWERLQLEQPAFANAVQADLEAEQAEAEAFNDILRCVPLASLEGLYFLACYACDLTFEEDGPAIERALPAYRVLAAIAGRTVFKEDLDDEED